VLSIFPFEEEWYAERVPGLHVKFVGHPMVERFSNVAHRKVEEQHPPKIVLLPGSRAGELRRHVPIVVGAARRIAEQIAATFCMVLPTKELVGQFAAEAEGVPNLTIQAGEMEVALQGASLAITKSGTITMECAFFGVPALVFYQTSALNYWIARRIVKVNYLAMPNLLADEPIFPEFIQQAATPTALSKAAVVLLGNPAQRDRIRQRLAQVVAMLGTAGAARRAAIAILESLGKTPNQGNSETR